MLRYFWVNRFRAPLFSRNFFKAWAKRFLTFPVLLENILARWRLTRQGAIVAPTSCIGKADIQGQLSLLRVGNSTFIGRALIMVHDRLEIGANVCINDSVTILTASHDVRDPHWRHIKAPIHIEDYAWIATGATLLPGVRIGRGAVVGAAAVVSRDVPPYAIATGNPAIIKADKRTKELYYNPVRWLAFQDAWLGKVTHEILDRP